MTKEKVGLYIRVSTAEQAKEGFGLEAQKNKLYSYCQYKGYDKYTLYCDAGISGKDTKKRVEFNKMLTDIKNKKINRVIAIKIDRISRNTVDFLTFFNLLQEYKCNLEILDINVDFSTPIGKLLLTVISAFAELERNLIVERTTDGMEEAANSGHFGGKPPLGYMKEVINGEKGKRWVINEEEAKVVREIFNLCLKGKTYNDIANIMQEKHSDMVAYTRKDKETGEVITIYRSWTDASICVILNNKSYIGIREHRKNIKNKDVIEIKDKIPAIVTKEVFDECQLNIERNKRNYYRNKKYLFMQKLVCPKCGRIMACKGTKKKTGQEYLYYKCKDCKTNFREDLIEDALVSELTLILELYLILEKNYVPIDAETARELNKGKLDNSIRYALDTMTIEKKLDIDYSYLTQIWDTVSYETKCDFIFEYIDTIKVKKHQRNGEPYIEILDLTFRPHMVRVFQEMFEKNMMDTFIDNNVNELSVAQFTSRKQADDYINILSKKYNIKVYERNDNTFGDNIFKIINIKSKNVCEKDDVLYVEVLA